MKIRDIKKYIKAETKQEVNFDLLGTEDEPFLKTMRGQKEKVNNYIIQFAAVASNPEEQLFYEFVQNAFDADADSLLFFANEQYLLILNNGKAFNSEELNSFLSKNQSPKSGTEQLGQYGQGSKLLYTLITDNGDLDLSTEDQDVQKICGKYKKTSEQKLLKAIRCENKGPYLISWSNFDQLNNLLLNKNEWEPCDPDDNNLLVIKILMGYFPIAPSCSEKFFSSKEIHDVIDTFNKLVDPRKHINRLRQGTALIIPLGNGKYDMIRNNDNIKQVCDQLGNFISIRSRKTKHKNKLNYIYILGQEITLNDIEHINDIEYIEVKTPKGEFDFAFNSKFASNQYVNLFQTLPIRQTKYGLGFIVDFIGFETDSTRQNISNPQETSKQLEGAFLSLVEELCRIKESEKIRFFYQCIIASQISQIKESNYLFVKDVFNKTLKPFIENNILTYKGNYVNKEMVFCTSEDLLYKMPLEEIGLKDHYWINLDVDKSLRENMNIYVKEIDLPYILKRANQDALKKWILTLKKDDEKQFHELCCKCILTDYYTFSTVPVFRSNKNIIYSYNELVSPINVFYLINKKITPDILDIYGNIEYIPFQFSWTENNWQNIFIDKIIKNIDVFRDTFPHKECACAILNAIWQSVNDEEIHNKITNSIFLFSNRQNDLLPFNQLFIKRPDGTTLFEHFVIKGPILKLPIREEWFLSTKEKQWIWIINNLDKIKKIEDWESYTNKYLNDLTSIYENEFDKIDLYIDENGRPSDIPCNLLNNTDKITEEEYNKIYDFFSESSLVAYKYIESLSEEAFSIEHLDISDIIEEKESIPFDIIKICFKLSDNLLDDFFVTEQGEKKYAISRFRQNGKNYRQNFQNDKVVNVLESMDYHAIPPTLINTEEIKHQNFIDNLADSYDDMKNIIDTCDNFQALFPIVKDCNKTIIDAFFDRFDENSNTINFYKDENINQNDNRWQIIKFAAEKGMQDTIFSCIKYEEKTLPETIRKNRFKYNNHDYDLYELDTNSKDDNELIDDFLAYLPDGEYFKKYYYKDKIIEVDVDDLFDQLRDNYLSIPQLRFCLDYAIKKKIPSNLEIDEDESLSEALAMIQKEEFKGFDKYFNITNFDNEQQVYVPKDTLKNILLEKEYLPEGIQVWLDKESKNKSLFSSLRTNSDVLIKIRQNLLEDTLSSIKKQDINKIPEQRIEDTIEWIIKQNEEYEYNSNSFKTLNKFIDSLPDNFENIVLLRYTGKISNKENTIKPIFTLEQYEENNCYFLKNSFCDAYEKKLPILKDFFNEHNIFFYDNIDLLIKKGLKPNILDWNENVDDVIDKKEWSNDIYKKWSEEQDIKIFTSNKTIENCFSIYEKDETTPLFCKKENADDYGYNKKKKWIIIKDPKEISILNFLRAIAPKITFLTTPFIDLQGRFLDPFNKIKEEAENKGISLDDVVKIIKNDSGGNNHVGDSSKSISETLKQIQKKFTDEDLAFLLKFDRKKLMDILKSKDKEEEEPSINGIIGYIGELIFKQYHKEFEFSADNGIGEYDFFDKKNQIYYDIKTTIIGLAKGKAPFYIHRSQREFLKENPNCNYYVVRISLDDLGLKDEYNNVKSQYGKIDPRKNAKCKIDCENIAKEYCKAFKINNFETKIHVYKLEVEM